MIWGEKPKSRLQVLREKRDKTQKDADAEQDRLRALYEQAVSEHGKASYEVDSIGQELGQSLWDSRLELEWLDDALLVEEVRSLGGFFESPREKADYWADDPEGREGLSVLGRTDVQKLLAHLRLVASEQRNATRATRIATAALWLAGVSVFLNPLASRILTYIWP